MTSPIFGKVVRTSFRNSSAASRLWEWMTSRLIFSPKRSAMSSLMALVIVFLPESWCGPWRRRPAFALNLQNRLQTEHGSDGCCSRSDAAALFQVLQSSYSDIDAGVEAGFFQPGSDLIGRETVFSLLDSLDGRVT